jgi:hypothetical protein
MFDMALQSGWRCLNVVAREINSRGHVEQAILLADPIVVEGLEMLERQGVKQHHDEQHLGT